MKRYLTTSLIALGLGMASGPAADAAGTDPFLGQIAWFGGTFAPRGWAFCDGQLLPINQNQSLYSLLGTTYGGDGRTTFALPDVRGRTVVHEGDGYALGQKTGAETTTYTQATMAAHSHGGAMQASNTAGDFNAPTGLAIGQADIYSTTAGTQATLMGSSVVVGNTGGGQAVNNMQPSMTINCIIALQGTFPSRN